MWILGPSLLYPSFQEESKDCSHRHQSLLLKRHTWVQKAEFAKSSLDGGQPHPSQLSPAPDPLVQPGAWLTPGEAGSGLPLVCRGSALLPPLPASLGREQLKGGLLAGLEESGSPVSHTTPFSHQGRDP